MKTGVDPAPVSVAVGTDPVPGGAVPSVELVVDHGDRGPDGALNDPDGLDDGPPEASVLVAPSVEFGPPDPEA